MDAGRQNKRANVKSHTVSREDIRKRQEEDAHAARQKRHREAVERKRRDEAPPVEGAAQAEISQALAQHAELLPQVSQALASPEPSAVLHAVTYVRQLMCLPAPPVDAILASGVVPQLGQLLTVDSPPVQIQACWALSNILAGTTAHVLFVLQCPGVLAAIQALFGHPLEDIKEQAVTAIGNALGDSARARDAVLNQGPALQALVSLARDTATKPSLLHTVLWALSRIVAVRTPAPPFALVGELLPLFVESLASHPDAAVQAEACWGVAHLCQHKDDGNAVDQALVQANVPQRVFEMLQTGNPQLVVPALRTIANITLDRPTLRGAFPHESLCQVVVKCLRHTNATIRKEACFTVSCVVAADPQHPLLVAALPDILRLAEGTTEFNVKKEAIWCIRAVTPTCNATAAQQLAQLGVFNVLTSVFDSADPRLVDWALDAVENLLRVGGQPEGNPLVGAFRQQACCTDRLDGLLSHRNTNVYRHAMNILDEFFPCGVGEAND